MFLRAIFTVAILVVWGWLDFFIHVGGAIAVGTIAGKQFESSNGAYLVARSGMGLFSFTGMLVTIVGLVLLFLLWRKPARRFLHSDIVRDLYRGGLGAIILGVLLAHPASAYFDKYDYTEPHYILPNQTAFWVPDNGDNKSSQVQFQSEDYYNAHKIAAKLFIIPHVKLPGSGFWSDFYIPAGRLYIVDRTPYNQEWTERGRGTNNKVDESIHCQTHEGLNVTAEVTMAASIHDADAAKYLYHFGVLSPSGDASKPEWTFTSVLYSQDLTNVMDGVGRDAVVAVVCDEFAVRTFDQANADMAKEMQDIRTKISPLLASWGITVDFMGWAGTFSFDTSVQKAIDNAYEAKTIQPMLPTLQEYADITVKQGLARGLAERGLPNNLVLLPSNMMGALAPMFGQPAAAAAHH